MSRVKIKNAVTVRKRITKTIKDPLYLTKCDCCGKIFDMQKWCNEAMTPGLMTGTFDTVTSQMGNSFLASVCSFACAHTIFNYGWKHISTYNEFKKLGAKLVRAELGITALVKSEDKAIAEWERKA